MDIEYIKKCVDDIEHMKGDDEMAHSNEDNLHVEFISYIAEVGNPEISEMAKEILKTGGIKFARWCA